MERGGEERRGEERRGEQGEERRGEERRGEERRGFTWRVVLLMCLADEDGEARVERLDEGVLLLDECPAQEKWRGKGSGPRVSS